MGFARAFLAGLLALPLAVGANPAERRQAELEALKARLERLQKDFQSTQSQRRDALDALRSIELAVSEGVRSLRELDQQRAQLEKNSAELERQKTALERAVAHQQTQLAEALKAAYRHRRDDALRILLEGDDPNRVARELRHLGQLGEARRAQIEALRADRRRLEAMQAELDRQAGALDALRARRGAEQSRLEADRQTRAQTLAQLSEQVRRQQREIETLRRNERTLTQLVERLNRAMAEEAARRQAAARAAERRQAQQAQQAARGTPQTPAAPAPRRPVAVNTDTPEPFQGGRAFASLKGQLRLPVAGELMNRFGAPREDGGMSWRGLFIRAAQGAQVKAIAPGQVVFADWLRGFGNLVILDHGDGYMSLYSNNESLYKRVGDRVAAGDAIAAVGNSGGQPETGLYFELRHQSRPINPMQWVK